VDVTIHRSVDGKLIFHRKLERLGVPRRQGDGRPWRDEYAKETIKLENAEVSEIGPVEHRPEVFCASQGAVATPATEVSRPIVSLVRQFGEVAPACVGQASLAGKMGEDRMYARFACTGAAALGLAACATTGGLEPPLIGTEWQLVKIAYMNDEVVFADAPERYTVTLESGGAATLRLDCNRGRSQWEGGDGQLRFGPIAGTRAQCPPGSLDARFTRDLGYVRSYVQRNGRLHLSLMADGAIMEFRAAR
jgi:heat shock protein HslJ